MKCIVLRKRKLLAYQITGVRRLPYTVLFFGRSKALEIEWGRVKCEDSKREEHMQTQVSRVELVLPDSVPSFTRGFAPLEDV